MGTGEEFGLVGFRQPRQDASHGSLGQDDEIRAGGEVSEGSNEKSIVRILVTG